MAEVLEPVGQTQGDATSKAGEDKRRDERQGKPKPKSGFGNRGQDDEPLLKPLGKVERSTVQRFVRVYHQPTQEAINRSFRRFNGGYFTAVGNLMKHNQHSHVQLFELFVNERLLATRAVLQAEIDRLQQAVAAYCQANHIEFDRPKGSPLAEGRVEIGNPYAMEYMNIMLLLDELMAQMENARMVMFFPSTTDYRKEQNRWRNVVNQVAGAVNAITVRIEVGNMANFKPDEAAKILQAEVEKSLKLKAAAPAGGVQVEQEGYMTLSSISTSPIAEQVAGDDLWGRQ